MNAFLKIVAVVFISSIKFLGGPPLAYAYRFNFAEIITYTVVGGMLGVVIVSYFSAYIMRAWNWIRYHIWKKKEIFDEPTIDIKSKLKIHYSYVPNRKQKVLFTRRTRKFVRFWKKYGLIGIAIITPVLLSIPVGAFFATRMVPDREKVFLYMFASILIWSVIITGILYKLIPVSTVLIAQ